MTTNYLIEKDNSFLVIVDVQEKLLPAVESPNALLNNIQCILQAAKLLSIPVVITEHCPDAIGHTVDELLSQVDDPIVIEKTHFCATDEPDSVEQIQELDRYQAVVVGTEAHVCVLQTAIGLKQNGFQITLASDAVSSRSPEDKNMALERIKFSGGMIATTEMIVFEWLERGNTEDFKAILPMIKSLKE